MSQSLDVQLRVRMRYEAGDAARRAVGDVETLAAKAQRLGTVSVGDRLSQGLAAVSAQAQAGSRDLGQMAQAASRLGAGAATARLATGLKDAGQAAGAAARDLDGLVRVSARFGSASTVAVLTRDLKAARAPAEALREDLAGIGKAAGAIGPSRGLATLEADLKTASRGAAELERHLASLAQRAGSRGGGGHGSGGGNGGGNGGGGEFAGEAFRAAGLGATGLRLGMSGAAAAGLAAGSGIALVGGAMAHATQQSISFEHAMTEVRKAVNETPEGIKDLEKDILGFSRASGIAKEEVAGLVAQAGYLNVPRDQLKGFAETATKAAIGFQMRGDETGEALGHLRAAYKLRDNAELRQAADAINAIGDNVGTRERDVLNYLNRTSGVAGMARIPLAKNAAIGGAVMSLGVAPDVASTGVTEVVGRLSNANLEGKEFQRGLRGIQMSGRQVKAMMDQDAVGGLLTVLEKINKLSDTKKPNVIRDMFGEGEIATVSRMAESVGKIREALNVVADPSKYAGSLEKTFKIFSSDTQAQIKRTEASIESFAAKIGSRLSPAVSAAAGAVERWFNGMNKAMDRGDKARAIADKMAKGEKPSAAEQAQLDVDPRLRHTTETLTKEKIDRALPAADEDDRAGMVRSLREGTLRQMEEKIRSRKAHGLDAGDLQRQLDAARHRFDELYPKDGASPEAGGEAAKGSALPGTGKRSDLRDGAKASLAAYHEEVAQNLDRTERLTKEFGKRMREDLEIRPKVQEAAFSSGGAGEARIEKASFSDGTLPGTGRGGGFRGGFGGGYGLGRGGSGEGGSGGGSGRHMPGRFGGMIPGGSGGGGRHPAEGGAAGGGGGHRAPSTAEGRENVASWMAFAQRPVDQGGLGLTEEQAHGMVAGLQGESGANLDPGAWNGNDRGKAAGGTAQWRDDRLRNLQAFAQERGGDWRDRGMQQQFLRHEFLGQGAHGGGSERRAYEGIRRSATRREALAAHVAQFERPQFPGAEIAKRSQYLNGHGGAEGGSEGGTAEGPKPGRGQPGENGLFDPLGGANRRYSSGFGMREHPVKGGRRMHWGQDMAAPAGTPVAAMQAGRVTAIARSGDVTITHPDGSTKTYRHIDPAGIRVGQEIAGGAAIGSLRAHDPRSTGPHLHMEATDAAGRKYDPRGEIDGANRPERALAGKGGGDKPEREEARSSRFMDPSDYRLKRGAGGGDPGAGGGLQASIGGASIVQHFHTGADAHEVGRRAQLEQNREIRRNMAGALHDVGHPVAV